MYERHEVERAQGQRTLPLLSEGIAGNRLCRPETGSRFRKEARSTEMVCFEGVLRCGDQQLAARQGILQDEGE